MRTSFSILFAVSNIAPRFYAPCVVFNVGPSAQVEMPFSSLKAIRDALHKQVLQLEHLLEVRDTLEADADITTSKLRDFGNMRTQLEVCLSGLWRMAGMRRTEVPLDALRVARAISTAALINAFCRLRRFALPSALVTRLHDELQAVLVGLKPMIPTIKEEDLTWLSWCSLTLMQTSQSHRYGEAEEIRDCVRAVVSALGPTALKEVLRFERDYPRLHRNLKSD